MVLKPGTSLPSVTLPTTDGSRICLAALRGRIVIAAYPWTGRPGHPNPPHWDNIPGAHGSTPELEGFRDLAASFRGLGVALYAVSRQSSDYQRELVQRLALPFPILSDAEGGFGAALSLPTFTTGDVTYLTRLTLVAVDGIITRVFSPVADPARHPHDVLRALQSESSSASSTE